MIAILEVRVRRTGTHGTPVLVMDRALRPGRKVNRVAMDSRDQHPGNRSGRALLTRYTQRCTKCKTYESHRGDERHHLSLLLHRCIDGDGDHLSPPDARSVRVDHSSEVGLGRRKTVQVQPMFDFLRVRSN
jgi:hypothetical protein